MSEKSKSKPSGAGLHEVKSTIFYVQPLIARYRMEVVSSLSDAFDVKIFASTRGIELLGFSRELPKCSEFVEAPILKFLENRISIQAKVLGRIVRERPAAVFMFADVTYLSLWLALLIGRLINVPIIIHGQGLYRYREPGFVRALCYRTAVSLSAKYVCYTETSKRSLEMIGCHLSKLTTASNSLEIGETIKPAVKTGAESGVLFIGRLRDGSNIECLIDAVDSTRNEGYAVTLHIVGGGEHLERLRQTYADRPYIVWYGALFDDAEIAKISTQCRIGCYPGAAGLSVVHMFGLSLPPLVHDDLPMHMGPEPEYVRHLETGFLYSRVGGSTALAAALLQVWRLPPQTLHDIARRAFMKYQQLNTPTLGRRLVSIIHQGIGR